MFNTAGYFAGYIGKSALTEETKRKERKLLGREQPMLYTRQHELGPTTGDWRKAGLDYDELHRRLKGRRVRRQRIGQEQKVGK